MKFNFKKIAPICAGAILLGSTIGFAGALATDVTYPNSFANAVVVVGAVSSDSTAAMDIAKDLGEVTEGGVSVSGPSVTEDEIALGGGVASGDLAGALDDSDISTLIDGKISWDDGDGTEDYNVHEEITVNGSGVLDIQTSLDDNDFIAPVMRIGEGGIKYLYVFDDTMNTSAIGTDDADALKLSILGKSIEFNDIDLINHEVTINLAEEVAMKEGDTKTVDGKTVTVTDIFETSVAVEVDGVSEIVSGTDTVNGIKIEVIDIGYSDTKTSKAVLKIGEDITKTYGNGDAYIGEADEDHPVWTWVITNTTTGTTGSPIIGIQRSDDSTSGGERLTADDEPAKMGESYTLPNDYASVTFVKLTDVAREEYTIDFDTSESLYPYGADTTREVAAGKIVILQGEDTESITINSTLETSRIALWYNSSTIAGNSTTKVYAYDDDDDAVFELVGTYQNNGTSYSIGDISNEDTTIPIKITGTNATANLNITLDNTGTVNDYIINVRGDAAYEYLGVTDDQADSADIYVGTVASGTKDNDIMDHNGTILMKPEVNADKDIVELSIPDERVYAEVTVSGSGATVSGGGISALVVKDNDVKIADYKATKNLIVIGGSAVNSLAGDLINCPDCHGADFTAATGVSANMAMIKLYSGTEALGSGKIALLVAGYETADTQAAANLLISKKTDAIGKTITKTTAGTYA